MPFPLNDLMFMNPVYCLPAALFTCVLLSATAASLHAETAYSTPCGYIQTDLNAKTTGYLGLGVHPEALMQHTLEENNITVSGSKITITDPDVNFTDLMETDSAYVLELIFGDEAMALPLNRDAWKKPAPSWTANKITVDDKSAADLIKNSKPVSYVLRKARALNDVLGGDNTFSLKSGTSGTADAVYISTSPPSRFRFTTPLRKTNGCAAVPGTTWAFSPSSIMNPLKSSGKPAMACRPSLSGKWRRSTRGSSSPRKARSFIRGCLFPRRFSAPPSTPPCPILPVTWFTCLSHPAALWSPVIMILPPDSGKTGTRVKTYPPRRWKAS